MNDWLVNIKRFPKIERYFAWGGIGVLAAILLITLSLEIYQVWNLPKPSSLQPLKLNQIVPQTQASLAQWHLFNPSMETSSANNINANFTLSGIILMPDEKLNRAILSTPDGKEQVYRVGEKLSDGTQVYRIFPDRVMLLHKGVMNVMEIPWERRHTNKMRER